MMPLPELRVRRGYCNASDGSGQVHFRICAPQHGTHLPPLLMLHPTPKSGWLYETIMPLLAAQGRLVLAPDTPGYGASDPPRGTASIIGYAQAMLALANELAPDQQIDVLGYHTGSSIAVEMALAAPATVRRLALFSIAAFDAETREAKLEALALPDKLTSGANDLQRMWEIVDALCDTRAAPEWRVRSVTENLRAADIAAGYHAVYRHDLAAALGRLSVPVLLVNAEDDLWSVTRTGRRHIHKCTYRELPRMAHGLFTFAAASIAAMLGAFFDDPDIDGAVREFSA